MKCLIFLALSISSVLVFTFQTPVNALEHDNSKDSWPREKAYLELLEYVSNLTNPGEGLTKSRGKNKKKHFFAGKYRKINHLI